MQRHRNRFGIAALAAALAVLALAAPSRALVNGIDVSHWQGTINWTSVKNAGIKFVFAKATEGVDFEDEKFDTYMSGAIAAGLPIGPYHFARLNSGETIPTDAVDEANDFVDAIQGYYNTPAMILRPVLDLEQIPNDPVTPLTVKQYVSKWVRDFSTRVQTRLGVTPIVYVGSSFAATYLETNINQYPLWLANWNYTPPNVPPPSAYVPWSSFAFWQYTSTGTVAGIAGNVDRDVFNGTMEELSAYIPGFLPGDYNGDGTVDTGDYTVWRDTMGQTVAIGLGADGNLSGAIDSGDYNVWKSHFGTSGAGGGVGGVAGVPEPVSLVLAAIAWTAALRLRLRFASRR
jgi:GH25 family lysozyme M1 (1,4-beta-N-acetylmuramidase)